MELHTFKRKTDALFRKYDSPRHPSCLALDTDMYKKLVNFFLAGESFYFMMNHHTMDFELVSDEIKTILGYKPQEFKMPLVLSIIHPEDRPYFLTMGETVADFKSTITFDTFLNYKLRYDFRYKKKDGSYCRLLFQALIVEHDGTDKILRSFGTFTDITYLKASGPPVLSLIGMNGLPSYVDVPLKSDGFSTQKDDLTFRERQVLSLLAEGKLSKEIAVILSISKETVDRHRKNMLRKKGLANSSELVSKAIRYGWI